MKRDIASGLSEPARSRTPGLIFYTGKEIVDTMKQSAHHVERT